MKKISLLFLALAVTLIGTTSPASAEDTPAAEKPAAEKPAAEKTATEKPSNYVLLKGGMYSPSMNFDIDNAVGGAAINDGKIHIDGKTGFAGEVAFGHYFLPMLAIELGGGYFQSKGSAAAQPGETMLKVVPLIATAKVFLPLGVFEPYGLAGIGAYITDLDVSGNSGDFHGSTEITYGFHAGAGFNINFTDKMFAGLEGKYIWAEPSFGGDHVKLDGFITTANIGYRF